MEQDYPDLAKLPETLKHLLCVMACRGWENVEDGFTLDANQDDRAIREIRETFPDAVWEGSRVIVTGEPARKFMALYRRAAGVPSLGNWIMENR